MDTGDIDLELRVGAPMQPQLYELADVAVRDLRVELVGLLDTVSRMEHLLALLREHSTGRASDTYFLDG